MGGSCTTEESTIIVAAVGQRIHDFIVEEILLGEARAQLTANSPLLEGVLDSIDLTQLVSFIEQEFGIPLEDADISRRNFCTVSAIERLVLSTTAAS